MTRLGNLRHYPTPQGDQIFLRLRHNAGLTGSTTVKHIRWMAFARTGLKVSFRDCTGWFAVNTITSARNTYTSMQSTLHGWKIIAGQTMDRLQAA